MSLGAPGRMSDARVWRISGLRTRVVLGSVPLRTTQVDMDDESFLCFLLGDSGHPITDFLITSFDDRGRMNHLRRSFNERFSRARTIVEHMFGQVKGRWRLLLGTIQIVDPFHLTNTIGALFALHNFLLRNGDECPEEWLADLRAEEQRLRAPGVVAAALAAGPSAALVKARGEAVRQSLVSMHSAHPFAPY
jgi:hypothetical protein